MGCSHATVRAELQSEPDPSHLSPSQIFGGHTAPACGPFENGTEHVNVWLWLQFVLRLEGT